MASVHYNCDLLVYTYLVCICVAACYMLAVIYTVYTLYAYMIIHYNLYIPYTNTPTYIYLYIIKSTSHICGCILCGCCYICCIHIYTALIKACTIIYTHPHLYIDIPLVYIHTHRFAADVRQEGRGIY